MDNEIKDKLKKIMSNLFKVDISLIHEDLNIENLDEWDSLAHMILITTIEQDFSIRFDDDLIEELTSFKNIYTHLLKEAL